jgi:hypothetical protein
MSEPSELEWLGFELAVQKYFIGRGAQAMILARLIRRAGLTCQTECLVSGSDLSESSVVVYVSTLRSQLKDLGFAAKIENVSGCGYRMAEGHAREIWDRVMKVVFHLSEAA